MHLDFGIQNPETSDLQQAQESPQKKQIRFPNSTPNLLWINILRCISVLVWYVCKSN